MPLICSPRYKLYVNHRIVIIGQIRIGPADIIKKSDTSKYKINNTTCTTDNEKVLAEVNIFFIFCFF